MIWCVEDDAGIREIELYTLRAAGFEVRAFADGASFWEALKNERPELILLDVMLPGLDGMELDSIKESIALLIGGGVDFEFRTTIVSELHTVEDIEALTKEIKGAKKYFLQNFVDSGDLLAQGYSAHETEVLKEMLTAAQKNIPEAALRGV